MVNYSLLVIESAGMMKMATGEGSPLRMVPGRAPKRFLVATEACGGGTPDLSWDSMFLGYVGLYRRKKSVGRCSRAHETGGHHPVRGAWPPISWPPRGSFDVESKSPGSYSSKNHATEGFILFGLRLIFLFFEILKQAIKQQYGLGLRLIG